MFTWKRTTLTDFYAKPLLVQLFKDGQCVYESPHVTKIRDICKAEIDTLWDEVKRFERPHEYFVDLSQDLWDIKDTLLKEHK